MVRLHELGWGTRRIAKEFGCSRNTVKRYLAADGWTPYGGSPRGGKLAGLDGWLRERFHRHRGNADVVRQELWSELSIEASLRTVERAVAPYRRELAAEAKATLRFETAPGLQLQIDFGESVRGSAASGRRRTCSWPRWTIRAALKSVPCRGCPSAIAVLRRVSWRKLLRAHFSERYRCAKQGPWPRLRACPRR